MSSRTPTLGILQLEGKMAQVPGCMAYPRTFPYPVVCKVVEGSSTPRSRDQAEAMLPLYIKAAQDLEQSGVSVITANCGLIALMQQELGAAVSVPVVTSALLMVPLVHRMLSPGSKVGILTFFTSAVQEENYRATGWSSRDVPVVLAGVSQYRSWLEFLETKEVGPALDAQLRVDLVATVRGMVNDDPEIGAFVSECTMLPAALQAVRDEFRLPVYDILGLLDWAVSGHLRLLGSGRDEERR